jgi:hypothetical protein
MCRGGACRINVAVRVEPRHSGAATQRSADIPEVAVKSALFARALRPVAVVVCGLLLSLLPGHQAAGRRSVVS